MIATQFLSSTQKGPKKSSRQLSGPQKCFFALQAFARKTGPQQCWGLGCNYFSGIVCFLMALKIAVSPGYPIASIPCMRKFFGSCLFFNGPQETLRGLLCPSPLHSQHHSGPVFPGFFPKLFCGRGQLIFFKKKYRWGLHIQRYSILRTAVVITPTSAENRSGMQRFGSDCIFHVDLRVQRRLRSYP